MFIAESHGLICEKLNYYGWTITTFNDEALAYFKRLNIKQFSYYYKRDLPEKKLLLRYQCPNCKNTTAWLHKHQDILCESCMCELIYTPTSKKYKKRKVRP